MTRKQWQADWEDFLFEEEVKLKSSGNVSSWLSDKWNSIKDSTKEALRKTVQEFAESKEAGALLARYASGEKLEPEEEEFLKTQAKDIIKGLGLVGVIALPGGSVALKFLLDAAQKFGIELRPSAFVTQEASPATHGDHWPNSSKSANNQMALMSFGFTNESVGSTDTLAKTITADLIDYLKNDYEVEDPDEEGYWNEYHFKASNQEISVDFSVTNGKTGTGTPFYIDSAMAPAEEGGNLIEIDMVFDDRYPLEKSFQDIYFKILEDIRHELEHIMSQKPGGNRGLSRAEYYIDKGEVPSMVRGLHLKAKKMKTPTEEIFRQELNPYLKSAEITPEEYDIILSAWRDELDKIQGKTK